MRPRSIGCSYCHRRLRARADGSVPAHRMIGGGHAHDVHGRPIPCPGGISRYLLLRAARRLASAGKGIST